jgi:hypothetical protein
MNIALLLWMACETAVPLPPRVQGPPPPNARMVQAAGVTGYLVQPITSPSPLAVLLLVNQLGAASRSEAMNHQGKTVLAIAPPTKLDAASAYLQALPHIQEVRIICRRDECSENSPSRRDPDRP